MKVHKSFFLFFYLYGVHKIDLKTAPTPSLKTSVLDDPVNLCYLRNYLGLKSRIKVYSCKNRQFIVVMGFMTFY